MTSPSEATRGLPALRVAIGEDDVLLREGIARILTGAGLDVVSLVGERPEGVGYLLEERVGDVATFVDAVSRVANGGSAPDPEVVVRMLGRRSKGDPLRLLTTRELAVLTEMAEGRSNRGIAQRRRGAVVALVPGSAVARRR